MDHNTKAKIRQELGELTRDWHKPESQAVAALQKLANRYGQDSALGRKTMDRMESPVASSIFDELDSAYWRELTQDVEEDTKYAAATLDAYLDLIRETTRGTTTEDLQRMVRDEDFDRVQQYRIMSRELILAVGKAGIDIDDVLTATSRVAPMIPLLDFLFGELR